MICNLIDSGVDKKLFNDLLRKVRAIDKQNIAHSVNLHKEVDWLIDFLFASKKSKFYEASLMNLVCNVDLHKDDRYVYSTGLQNHAYFVVLDTKTNRKYFDSSRYNTFITNNKYHDLRTGDVVMFDATKPHAMMIDGYVQGVTIWFRK